MTVPNPGVCCDQCFAMIATRCPRAAVLWLDLCDLDMQFNTFALETVDVASLRLLELFGFVITTDKDNLIIIKVLGRQKDDIGEFFCIGDCCD